MRPSHTQYGSSFLYKTQDVTVTANIIVH